jgi:hypothetical protein
VRLVMGPLTATVLAALLTACAAGGSTGTSGNVFEARQEVSLPQLQRAIDDLYVSHPDISSFAAQDVQYTDQSRSDVLKDCGPAGYEAASQTSESGRLIACAPLIYFLYSYGKQRSVADAVAVAGKLYWYAVTHITGPMNARATLNAVLRSWKLPVHPLSPAAAKKALEASLVAAAEGSILAEKSVHLVITGKRADSTAVTEQIVADMGSATGTESISSGKATAAIRVTSKDAYLAGNPAGLTTLLGLPSSAARKAGSRWVDIKAGTNEYKDLATEDSISSLPASVLPSTGDAVDLATSVIAGEKIYVLTWKAAVSGSSAVVSEKLVLAATAQALPIIETTVANGYSQAVTFGKWGESITIPVPATALPYSRVMNQH